MDGRLEGETKQNERLQKKEKIQKREVLSIKCAYLRTCIQTQTIRLTDGQMDGELGQINCDQENEDTRKTNPAK
jgi:hypothetical protein